MSASKHTRSTTRSTSKSSQERGGAGRGAAHLAPPAYGIALADQGPSPAVQGKGGGPAAVQMRKPPPAPAPTQDLTDDMTIRDGKDVNSVKDAFARFWGVDVVLRAKADEDDIAALQSTHKMMKPLPKDDTIENTKWTKLEISGTENRGLMYSNGKMVLPIFSRFQSSKSFDADKWRDETIIHEAGHAVEEIYGVKDLQRDFTENVAKWTVDEDEKNFAAQHPTEHAKLKAQTTPISDDPMNRMATAPDPKDASKKIVFTMYTAGKFAMFPEDTRTKAMNVSNYSLSSPREFFAEMYTAFYKDGDTKEFGKDDFGNAGGRLDGDWAKWIRNNIHKKDGARKAVTPAAATPQISDDLDNAILALTGLSPKALLQGKGGGRGAGEIDAQGIAATGTRGPAGALPHLDAIQRSFGPAHDLSAVQAHVGGPDAEAATRSFGATAFAMGDHVVFEGAPDLATAAHEAAHVVQQRAGVQLKDGVGTPGDPYERNADAVAGRVVQGQSAADLLDGPVR